MAINNREKAISVCLQWEGGYTNDPNDHGGATNWGITIADAQKYWKKNATPQDVKNMPKDVAIDIYRCKYWKTSFYDCDKLDAGVDLAVFDFGVNSGPSRSKKYLDQSVGGSAEDTVRKLCGLRRDFLERLASKPDQAKFRKGWINRVNDIEKKAVAMTKEPMSIPAKTGATAVGAGFFATLYTYWNEIVNYVTSNPGTTAAIAGAVVLAALIGKAAYENHKVQSAAVQVPVVTVKKTRKKKNV